MKKFLFLLLIFASTKNAPKLILHLDVNKTIIAEDLTNNKTLDHVLIESLAKQYKGIWDATLTEELSYVDYIKKYLVPGDKSNREIRTKRNKAVLTFFDIVSYRNDPRYFVIRERFEKIREKIRSQPGKIFPSLYKLITYLEEKKISYSIILRTFGNDLNAISDELATALHFTFEWEGYFDQGKLHLTSIKTKKSIRLDTIYDIFTFFKRHGHIKIKDNFKMWNDNHEQAEHGKLFPLNPIEAEIKTIFFDDNADENIINARDSISGSFIDPKKLIDQGIICLVDTLQAIEDDDYFIKHLIKTGIVSK